MHFPSTAEKETNYEFKLGKRAIGTTPNYRYLGFDINYCLNYDKSVDILCNAAG